MKPKSDQPELNCPHIGKQGRVLFSNIASMLIGEKVDEVKLKGTNEQVSVVKEALIATRNFHVCINSSNVTLDSISDSLEEKHRAAKNFERVLGIPWLL